MYLLTSSRTCGGKELALLNIARARQLPIDHVDNATPPDLLPSTILTGGNWSSFARLTMSLEI